MSDPTARRVECPSCGALMKAPVGKKVRCPECRSIFTAPASRRRREAEEDSAELEVLPAGREQRGLSIASLSLGVSSLLLAMLSTVGGLVFGTLLLTVCCCPFGYTAVYVGDGLAALLAIGAGGLGIAGLQRGGKAFAIGGIGTGAATLLLCFVVLVLSLVVGLDLASPPTPVTGGR